MDIDGDGGRRKFGLRGQRHGIESHKRTVANSLSGQGKSLPSKSALAQLPHFGFF